MKPPAPGCVGEFDWIELASSNSAGSHWARVLRTCAGYTVQVVLLKGSDPVSAVVSWEDGSWRIQHHGHDASAIPATDLRYWREVLREGPPLQNPTADTAARRPRQGHVWRLASNAA